MKWGSEYLNGWIGGDGLGDRLGGERIGRRGEFQMLKLEREAWEVQGEKGKFTLSHVGCTPTFPK